MTEDQQHAMGRCSRCPAGGDSAKAQTRRAVCRERREAAPEAGSAGREAPPACGGSLEVEIDSQQKEWPEQDREQCRHYELDRVQVLEVMLVRGQEDADSDIDSTEELWRKDHECPLSLRSELQSREPGGARFVCPTAL